MLTIAQASSQQQRRTDGQIAPTEPTIKIKDEAERAGQLLT
jgi:hypothetical protein